MNYINATKVLPKELINEIQQYITGDYLYIPVKNKRQPWGAKTGSKSLLMKRNQQIYTAFLAGTSIKKLAKQFFLSESSIRKILTSFEN
ncbi:hypothetical protein CKN73_06195 [Carnobacterium divergens]|uniref:Mor transcription activator domain-containing protein n=2 Tax=Carnobacterium divergens TaxID=2748 RepID=A0A0R2HZI3_CARDV|nr:CD3324 family protein [Carnobacterium divergens]MDV8934752.1 CD3324 family protein [Carnobacterium sp.]KRN57870.1 hypothetical protein IV74_GL001125 [Carnobacterium divergens DSM 20623]MCO6017018.1 CD3324 family protein [Carnobacterium divergens]MDO0874502.1 CD3324 family protein [Carnobacterium divergens]MDT1940351.1 CD3324 family protein [Carnobacterium divergens]